MRGFSYVFFKREYAIISLRKFFAKTLYLYGLVYTVTITQGGV